MARHHNPTLTTSGLILCLDVNNSRGYDQGTPSLTDLTKRDTTVTFYNSPTANSNDITFDGTNDFIRVERSDLNGGTFQPDYITMCMWVWPDPTASTSDNNVITVENSFEVRFKRRNSTHASIQYASNPWAWVGDQTADALPLGEWSLLTFTHGVTYAKLYVNDQLHYTHTHSGSRPLAGGTASYPYMTIGARLDGTASIMKGKIGSVLLYDRELSQEEISKNFYARRGKYSV